MQHTTFQPPSSTNEHSNSQEVKKLTMKLPPDTVTPLLGIYPQGPKTLTQKDTWSAVFTAALLPITSIWTQSQCPCVGERIKTLWYIYTAEYCWLLKKKGMLPFATA